MTTRALTINLDGYSNFETLWGQENWDVPQNSDDGTWGWLGYLSIWHDDDQEILVTTSVLSGTNWEISTLQFGGAYGNIAIVNDEDAGEGRSINHLKLGKNSDVDLISTSVKFISGYDGDLHDLKLGSAYTTSIELSALANIVHTGTGGVGSISLGHGENSVVTDSGWVGQIDAGGNNDITIGSGGVGRVSTWGDGLNEVKFVGGYSGSLELGGGENIVKVGIAEVASITCPGQSVNHISIDGGDVEFIRLSKGVNDLHVEAGDVASVVAYRGATTNITLEKGSIDQIRLGAGTHTITAIEDGGYLEGFIGSILVYQGQTTLTLGSGGSESVRLGDGADRVVTGSGYVRQLDTEKGDDVIELNGDFGTVRAGQGNDSIFMNSSSFGEYISGGSGADTFYMQPLEDIDGGFIIEGGYDSSIDTLDLSDFTSNLTVSLENDINWQDLGSGWVALAGIEGLTGGSGNDRLTGSSFGSSQNNVLNGGTGTDTLIGGLGDDTYVTDGGDTITEAANAGTDTVQSSATITLGANLENLTLTGSGAINGTGNALNNVITGNGGNNILNGGTGTDTLIGGLGDDTYVTDGGDTISEAANAGTDTVQSSATITLGANVENLTLTGSGAINGTGNALNNVITGNGGNNTLTGDAGNDTLNGGTGTDTLIGGLGDDTYVTDGGDTITEAANAGTDTVQSSATITLGANLENLTLTGSAAINGTGNTLSNVLTGNSGANRISGGGGNDTIIGGAGNDTLEGAAGNDSLTGGEGTDTASYASATAAVTVSLALTTAQNTVGAGTDTLTTIENLTGSSFNDTLTGSSSANTIIGGAGNDVINGGAGNDVLTGGIGADAFVFNFAPNATTNLDTITDFNVVDDTIQLENSIFTALGLTTGTLSAANFVIGTAAADATDRIIYNSTTGALLYDSNGNVAGGSVQIATLATGLAMTNNDFLII
jgi:Ca2+-binding RTX toxin-like protein